ncbi:MAG TPA: Ig-like domain-containing protein [Jiangellales bacterium]|nr:Ig-like domain-containing protein [Jiangellales bacterium]
MRRVVVLAMVTALSLAACGRESQVPQQVEGEAGAAAAPLAPAMLRLAPELGATNLPVSTEININVTGGALDEVRLVRAGTADPLPGGMRDDGSAWVPAAPLAYATGYEATVTATGEDGKQVTQTTSFTTMGQPGAITSTGLYAQEGQTVGVAMPITVEFDGEIPASARADIQRRLFAETTPPQPGVWSWSDNGRQVWYRAPDYWKPGTTISVRAALEGVPMGDGTFGDSDRTATVTVANKVFLYVDNASKQMQVYVDDQLARTMPVSLGKPSTPSSSGFMVLMSHEPTSRFDTRGEPDGGYVLDVDWAMRLTWGGEYIHSAPWSVGQQGRYNVSHGCVNLSPANAQWLFNTTHVGDPIMVRGTEVTLEHGNGWTAWHRPWSEYVKGSALPVPEELANAAAVDPLTGTPPAPPASTTPTEPPATAPASQDPAARPTD